MKLRNKKTGKIEDFGNLQVYAEIENTYESQLLGNFNSFGQILEYYEDYKPKEPLIKDEKIRKAVRAWAEVVSAKTVAVAYSYENKTLISSKNGAIFQSPNYIEIEGADDYAVNDFTIAELCGEEE